MEGPFRILLLLVLLASPAAVNAQTTAWLTSSTSCTNTATVCPSSTNNYIKQSLTYSTTTGIFTGTFVLNLCPNYTSTYSYTKFGVTTTGTYVGAVASCNTLTLPYITQSQVCQLAVLACCAAGASCMIPDWPSSWLSFPAGVNPRPALSFNPSDDNYNIRLLC